MPRKRTTASAPPPFGDQVTLEGKVFLVEGPDAPGPFPAWIASAGEARHRLLELPAGAAPEVLERAFRVPGVAPPVARRCDEERTLVALRAVPGPRLAWVLERNESLPLWSLPLVDRLAALFQAVHDAGLCFGILDLDIFSVGPGGELALECPETLCEPDQPIAEESPSVFHAPEWGSGRSSPAADQHALGAIAYALLTGRRPLPGPEFPPLRIFRRDLPHGVQTAVLRAVAREPAARHPSCAAFAADLRLRSCARGESVGTLHIGADSTIGQLKGQHSPINQDAWFAGYDPASRRGLLLVADGISTADVGSGDLASRMVRDAVEAAWDGAVGEILRSHKGPMPPDWASTALQAILEEANARIFAFLKQPIFVGALGPRTHPPGSTAVLAVADGDHLTVANVGDSRLYLLRDGALEQMTVDQDVRTELIAAGRDPRGAADTSALGALTRSVGNFFFDAEGGILPRPLGAEIQRLTLRRGDRLLLCTDGLPDCLGDQAEEVMARELAVGDDPQKIARRLCTLADDALGADNITALVALAT